MHAVLVVVGSRGDVVPVAALAGRLVAAGHRATVVTHRALVPTSPAGVDASSAPGVDWVGVDGDPAELLAGPAGRALRRLDARALNRTRGQFAEFAASVVAPTADLMADADVLVATSFAMAAVPVARDAGVPVVRAHLWPEHPGLDGPMPLLPYAWALPPAPRRGARWALRAAEPLLAGFDGWWEGGRLHTEPHHPAGMTTGGAGTLHAVSPALLAAAGELPAAATAGRSQPTDTVLTTGWWTSCAQVELSAATRAVLDGPGPWVYVGFGSMPQRSPSALLDTIDRACAGAGVHAVVQLPGAPAGATRGRAVVIGPEPHEALFPRVALAVHHGGAGTTAAAVRAGIPSVVVPHLADQFYWGHVLNRAGVAPRALPRPGLSAAVLARRIRAAHTPAMRARAEALGRVVRAEDGTGAAVAHLEAVVRGDG